MTREIFISIITHSEQSKSQNCVNHKQIAEDVSTAFFFIRRDTSRVFKIPPILLKRPSRRREITWIGGIRLSITLCAKIMRYEAKAFAFVVVHRVVSSEESAAKSEVCTFARISETCPVRAVVEVHVVFGENLQPVLSKEEFERRQPSVVFCRDIDIAVIIVEPVYSGKHHSDDLVVIFGGDENAAGACAGWRRSWLNFPLNRHGIVRSSCPNLTDEVGPTDLPFQGVNVHETCGVSHGIFNDNPDVTKRLLFFVAQKKSKDLVSDLFKPVQLPYGIEERVFIKSIMTCRHS